MVFTIMTELLLPATKEHHTVADWDFATGYTKYLDTGTYIEPPSSLRFRAPYGAGRFAFLCRIDGTVNLPQGQFHTWWRSSNLVSAACIMYFRNQSPLGTATTPNTYFFSMYNNGLIVGRYYNNGLTNYWTLYRPRANNTWYRYRITWWQSVDIMLVRVEEWNGAEWVCLADNITVNPGLWFGAAQNRVGLGQRKGRGWYYSRVDETYIFGPE